MINSLKHVSLFDFRLSSIQEFNYVSTDKYTKLVSTLINILNSFLNALILNTKYYRPSCFIAAINHGNNYYL